MPCREYIKNEIDALPDSALEKVREFIASQKISPALAEHDKELARDMEMASLGSAGFWDNPDDEVWNHV